MCSVQIALDTTYWTVFNHITIWGSLAIYFIMVIGYFEGLAYLFTASQRGVAFRAMQTPQYWLVILLTTVVLIVPMVS